MYPSLSQICTLEFTTEQSPTKEVSIINFNQVSGLQAVDHFVGCHQTNGGQVGVAGDTDTALCNILQFDTVDIYCTQIFFARNHTWIKTP